MRAATSVLALLIICGGLSACESTQDKSARLAKSNAGAGSSEQGVTVARASKDVKVVSTEALQDANGAAAVVTVRSVSKQPLSSLPIAIDVKGAKRASVFRNDQPGLEPSLASISALPARKQFSWVNDQLTPTGKARSVVAKVGDGKPLTGTVPRISLSGTRLEGDPVSGVSVVGKAANESKVEQRKLVVYAVARKKGRVVAAGRGQIKKLAPGKRGSFTVFFIGNPKGAKLELSAPPTTFK